MMLKENLLNTAEMTTNMIEDTTGNTDSTETILNSSEITLTIEKNENPKKLEKSISFYNQKKILVNNLVNVGHQNHRHNFFFEFDSNFNNLSSVLASNSDDQPYTVFSQKIEPPGKFRINIKFYTTTPSTFYLGRNNFFIIFFIIFF